MQARRGRVEGNDVNPSLRWRREAIERDDESRVDDLLGENANDVRVRIAEMQSLVALSGSSAPELRHQYAAAYGYLAERKYDRALTAFNLSNKLFPDFPLTYWKLGLLYEAMGDVDKARENFTHYQQLVTEQKSSPYPPYSR